MAQIFYYAPNTAHDNKKFWDKVHTYFISHDLATPDILLGYFNLVEEPIDRKPAKPSPSAPLISFQTLKNDFSPQDGWRTHNPTKIQFTFSQNNRAIESRLDRIYTSNRIFENSYGWSIDKVAINTDHELVYMSFANPSAPFIGKGRWTLPPIALRDITVLNHAKKLGQDLIRNINIITDESRLPTNNAQYLFQKFKSGLTSFARTCLRTHTVPHINVTLRASQELYYRSTTTRSSQTMNDNSNLTFSTRRSPN